MTRVRGAPSGSSGRSGRATALPPRPSPRPGPSRSRAKGGPRRREDGRSLRGGPRALRCAKAWPSRSTDAPSRAKPLAAGSKPPGARLATTSRIEPPRGAAASLPERLDVLGPVARAEACVACPPRARHRARRGRRRDVGRRAGGPPWSATTGVDGTPPFTPGASATPGTMAATWCSREPRLAEADPCSARRSSAFATRACATT